MKHLIGALVAIALVAGAAFYVFGPETGQTASGTDGTLAAQRAGGPPGGRPGGPGRGNLPSIVTLQTIETAPFQTLYQAIGTVEASARVTVQSEVTGRVQSVLIASGAEVEPGAPLVVLDTRSQELELASATAQLAEAQNTVDRYANLLSTNAGTVSAVSLQEAKTALELAKVALDRAQYELDRRTITAPIGGKLGLTDIAVGSYINTGTEVVTISNLDQVELRFDLPERATEVLRQGLPVRVTLPSRRGQVFAAEVSEVDTGIDPVTRQIEVVAVMDNTAHGLTHGAVASVIVAQEREPLPTVPAVAITWGREGAGVWVAEEGTARRIAVTVAHRVDDTVWVRGDLKDGDQIVVEGVQKVREGAQVMTAEQMQEIRRRSAQAGTGGANG